MTTAATAWQALATELDTWTAAGRQAQVWWRDDDAGVAASALERLLELAAATRVPLALAVIPTAAESALAVLLGEHAADTSVMQHGYGHTNHAPAGAKKCELVEPTAHPTLLAELRRGRERLAELFGARLQPVMVPPWNRIAPALAAQLPGLGFSGLSTYQARRAAEPAPGLAQVNCHLDILQWRPKRQFLGTAAALALLTSHLAGKRTGAADAGEPSGILSHHQAHDEAAWDFLGELLDYLARHPGVRLMSAAETFPALPAEG